MFSRKSGHTWDNITVNIYLGAHSLQPYLTEFEKDGSDLTGYSSFGLIPLELDCHIMQLKSKSLNDASVHF